MRRALTAVIDSPIGPLLTALDDEGRLSRVVFLRGTREEGEKGLLESGVDVVVREDRSADPIAGQLVEYFEGRRREFDLPLAPRGTAFQLEAWTALRTIPYGQTRTYSEQAALIGRPRAVRAIGRANGANPIPIIIPCHRVVGADGSLTGFGGGLPVKRRLLELEGVLLPFETGR